MSPPSVISQYSNSLPRRPLPSKHSPPQLQHPDYSSYSLRYLSPPKDNSMAASSQYQHQRPPPHQLPPSNYSTNYRNHSPRRKLSYSNNYHNGSNGHSPPSHYPPTEGSPRYQKNNHSPKSNSSPRHKKYNKPPKPSKQNSKILLTNNATNIPDHLGPRYL